MPHPDWILLGHSAQHSVTMPAPSSVAISSQGTTYHRLATDVGEKCGLAPQQK